MKLELAGVAHHGSSPMGGEVGVGSGRFGVVKLCGNRPTRPVSVRPLLREKYEHPMLAETRE